MSSQVGLAFSTRCSLSPVSSISCNNVCLLAKDGTNTTAQPPLWVSIVSFGSLVSRPPFSPHAVVLRCRRRPTPAHEGSQSFDARRSRSGTAALNFRNDYAIQPVSAKSSGERTTGLRRGGKLLFSQDSSQRMLKRSRAVIGFKRSSRTIANMETPSAAQLIIMRQSPASRHAFPVHNSNF